MFTLTKRKKTGVNLAQPDRQMTRIRQSTSIDMQMGTHRPRPVQDCSFYIRAENGIGSLISESKTPGTLNCLRPRLLWDSTRATGDDLVHGSR